MTRIMEGYCCLDITLHHHHRPDGIPYQAQITQLSLQHGEHVQGIIRPRKKAIKCANTNITRIYYEPQYIRRRGGGGGGLGFGETNS